MNIERHVYTISHIVKGYKDNSIARKIQKKKLVFSLANPYILNRLTNTIDAKKSLSTGEVTLNSPVFQEHSVIIQ